MNSCICIYWNMANTVILEIFECIKLCILAKSEALEKVYDIYLCLFLPNLFNSNF